MDEGAMAGRYRVLEGPAGPEIGCINTPNVRLRVRRGVTVTRRTLRKQPPRTVFLDGAFEGEPFHDHERRVYSLDHHAGCLRPITLSSCEQAATLLVLGLPLKEGDWTIHVNEPDLDAVLGAWVCLNHLELTGDDPRLLRDVMALLRVEGVIDVHGLGKGVLTGLPDDELARQMARIDRLMEPVRALKAEGAWSGLDAVPFTLQLLDEVDRLVLPAGERARLGEFEETARIPLRGQRVAVLCRSSHGIYEVEEHLRRRYGKVLGLVVLDAGEGRFTLRRTDAFLDAPLARLYRRLNRRDPNAHRGAPEGDAWGGAGDIGGSPRARGSGLSGTEVLAEVARVFGERASWWRRLWRWGRGPGRTSPG